jgi:hypothetical protein
MDLLEQDEQASKLRPGIILESCHFEMSILLLFIEELLTTPVVCIYYPFAVCFHSFSFYCIIMSSNYVIMFSSCFPYLYADRMK